MKLVSFRILCDVRLVSNFIRMRKIMTAFLIEWGAFVQELVDLDHFVLISIKVCVNNGSKLFFMGVAP